MHTIFTPEEPQPTAALPSEESKPTVALSSEEVSQYPYDQRDSEVKEASESRISPIELSDSLPSAQYDAPIIPESYRQTIGPVVRHISFGERYQEFEAEPIDISWAQAMEAGIHDFIANHGPKYGEVFEFVQCRSLSCVLAGYTIPGHEVQGASVIGTLSRQPWWQASRKASSTHSSAEGRTTFVTIIPRYDE